MKATSLVFSNVQKPLTVFGLPPAPLALAAALSVIPYGFCVLVGAEALSLPALVVTFVALVYYIAIRNRADIHYAHLLIDGIKPWKGNRKFQRSLVAGRPLDRKERG